MWVSNGQEDGKDEGSGSQKSKRRPRNRHWSENGGVEGGSLSAMGVGFNGLKRIAERERKESLFPSSKGEMKKKSLNGNRGSV